MMRTLAMVRFLPMLMFCVFLGIAFARVYEAEREKAAQPSLPTPVGHRYAEASFPMKVREELSVVWMEFYNAVIPGLMPIPPEKVEINPNSLEALKQRSTPVYVETMSAAQSY